MPALFKRVRSRGIDATKRNVVGVRWMLAVRRVSHVSICVLICLLGDVHYANAQSDTTKTVLILYDGGREFSSIALMDRTIESTLNKQFSNRVTIFREYMDLTRIDAMGYEQKLRDFYRLKYSSNVPDVIVAIRGRPLDFILNAGDELFPGVPIVSSGMDSRQVQARHLPDHVTGKTLHVRYAPTLKLALALQPGTKHIVFVMGGSPNDRALEALVRDEFDRRASGRTLTFLTGLPVRTLTQQLSRLPPRSIVMFISLAQDGAGRSFLPSDAVALVSRSANAPTYINSDDVIGLGAVGGDLISFAALGHSTAELTSRLLMNASERVPFADATERETILDARQLLRWDIPLSRVPPGSILLNNQPSLWKAYRWWIVGGVCLLILQGALIVMLLVNRRRRRAAEGQLRISETSRLNAVTEERNRLARDMHDTLAQGFTGVIVQLQAAQYALAHGASVDMDGHMQRAIELARQSLGEARRSIRALRPLALEDVSLCVAFEQVTMQAVAGTQLRSGFTTIGTPRTLPALVEENLLRIYQEILTNVLKHAGADSVTASLSFDEQGVRLEVTDDGRGFDSSNRHDGLGLIGIRERVYQMNGKLAVESGIGKGTRIDVFLPQAGEPEEDPSASTPNAPSAVAP